MVTRSSNSAPETEPREVPEILSPGLYVHVPFCRSRCSYCDFHVSALRWPVVREYVSALVKEIEFRAAEGFEPRTIFIGGGTPSALDRESWDTLLGTLSNCFGGDLLEWTVEMNPESIDAEKIEIALSHGVNRVSTGAQTFDEKGLSLLGRRHDASRVFEVHQLLDELGVPRTSLDLIVGWPGQDLDSVRKDLDAVAVIDPDHISLYHLSYENGTWLHTMRNRGAIDPLQDETCIRLSRLFLTGLAEQEYHRYEVSNLFKRGGESLHNLNYWKRGTYLGVGSGAASFYNGERWKNRPDVSAYISAAGCPERVEKEVPVGFTVLFEKIMLGLRLLEGISPAEIFEETGYDIVSLCAADLRRYEEQGFLIQGENSLRVTDQGMDLLDEMIVNLLEELERTGDGKEDPESSGFLDSDAHPASKRVGG
ncbi:MAG: radical SAM family heme chaperone HemW [Planctomycetota bacterium]